MTAPHAALLVRSPRRAPRPHRLAVVVVGLVLAGGGAFAAAAVPRADAPAPPTRTAFVADAGGAPLTALERAQAAAGPGVAVRVPRTAAEAAADVRYFAAGGYGAVVAAGPLARGAARDAAPAYPRTRFTVRRALR